MIVTILPPVFCANICLMESWVTYRKPSTFVETSDLKSSAAYSVNGLLKKMPALLTSASIDLKRDRAVSTILGGSCRFADVAVHQCDVVGSRDLGGLGYVPGIGDDVETPPDK